MVRKAIIEIEVKKTEEAKTLYKALIPEAKSAPTSKTKAKIYASKQKIKIIIETDTTSSLRAALNSYLSWVSSILKTLKRLE